MKKSKEQSYLKHLQTTAKAHPLPLQGMRPYARHVWKRLIDSHPVDHFKPCNFEQLRAYCELSCSLKTALNSLKKEGEIVEQSNGVIKRNPWCQERDSCIALMNSISTKLGINVNSKNQKGLPKKKTSARERAGLLFGGKDQKIR